MSLHGHAGYPPFDRTDGTVDAYANIGRWVADCPSCNLGQVIDPDDPLFWCPACQPIAWRTIVVPGRKLRGRIERTLMRRAPENRNWHPWETIEMLEVETEHGGPIDHLIVTPKLVHAIAPGAVLHPDSELA